MSKLNSVLFSIIILFSYSYPQENILHTLLKQNNELFGDILSKQDSFEVQIIYTQINRDEQNKPCYKTFNYNVDSKNYFYPASTVKMPLAFLALEKINNLKIKGLNKFTPLIIDSARGPQTSEFEDHSSADGLPSIAQYIKKVFLVSDNNSYNRLYEFLGQKEINNRLHEKGFNDVKIVHRFVPGFTVEENRHTNPISFLNNDSIIYRQPGQYNDRTYSFELNNLIKGIGYTDSRDSLITKPFDFTNKNYASLESLTEILKTVLFPETKSKEGRFNLNDEDYKFLYKYMSMLPGESHNPDYDSTYFDSYVKFLMFGDSKDKIDDNIRIFNKVGLAYGYLTDIAYIVDFENNIEFMLSAVIHVNKNRIYNDGVYEYNSIGLPFLANLGRVIYEYELTRERKNKPKLDKFHFEY